MRRSRRALLRLLTLSLAGVAVGGLAGCSPLAPTQHRAPGDPEDDLPDPAARADRTTPTPSAPVTPTPVATPISGLSSTVLPAAASTPGQVLTVAVPPTPTAAPPAPVPTATPRPRPVRAMVTVPYYSQQVGRLNYCLPTSIAMVADRYGLLPAEVSGTPALAPHYVADVAYSFAREQIAALDESQFKALWEEIGTDPLGGLIWNVFAPNGRDLAAGMSPALAYLVLQFSFGLTPVLGTLEECLVALDDDVPSILFGSYDALRRADGILPNVGGYTGPHAFVLVGIDHDRLIVNDPLPSDKSRYSGERSRSSAALRAVRFDLASVQRMTRGDGGKPRGDCFMVPAPGTEYLPS